MKKSLLTIGLCSLVMVLTSFTTPETDPVVTIDANGNVEVVSTVATQEINKKDVTSSSIAMSNKKVEIIGSGSTGGNKKVDEMPNQDPSFLDKVKDWWNGL